MPRVRLVKINASLNFISGFCAAVPRFSEVINVARRAVATAVATAALHTPPSFAYLRLSNNSAQRPRRRLFHFSADSSTQYKWGGRVDWEYCESIVFIRLH